MAETEIDLSAAISSLTLNQRFQLPPLYRLGADGKIWIWIISFDGTNLVSCWETLNNFNQGVVQKSTRRVDLNTRSVNLYEQALLEARAEVKKKKDKQGYGEQLIQHDIFSLPAMLCTTWDPKKNQLKRWPVHVMPKLDGVRCRMHILPRDDGTDVIYSDVKMLSRATQVINNLNGIREKFTRFYRHMEEVIRHYLPNISPLFRTDGELYTHELSFDRSVESLDWSIRLAPMRISLDITCLMMLTIDDPYNKAYLLLNEAYNRHVVAQGAVRYLHF